MTDYASGIVAVTQGRSPRTRVVCPRPIVSSTSLASPGPKTCFPPSPRPISSWPERMMTNWRRGAGCQSRYWPSGHSRNEICVAAMPFVHSGARPRSIGSMCDCPSEPVKSRNVPIALLPFPWSEPMGWGLTTTRFENLAGFEERAPGRPGRGRPQSGAPRIRASLREACARSSLAPEATAATEHQVTSIRRSPTPVNVGMALVAETGGADPARLRDVEDDPIRAAVLHLDVAAMAAALSHPERLVDVVAERRAGLCQLLGNGLEALDLEADVVDATVALATLDPGHLVVLEVEDRQVEVAVAQVVARGTRAVDPGDLLHAEHLDVELRGLLHVLGRDGDVLDLRHGVSCLDGACRSPVLVSKGTPKTLGTPGC